MKKYFPDELEGRLTKFPMKEKQRFVVLSEIVKHLNRERTYGEKELNKALGNELKPYGDRGYHPKK